MKTKIKGCRWRRKGRLRVVALGGLLTDIALASEESWYNDEGNLNSAIVVKPDALIHKDRFTSKQDVHYHFYLLPLFITARRI